MIQNIKNILTFSLIFTAFFSFAQNKTIDSLLQALKEFDASRQELHKSLAPNEYDSTKVKILNDLSLKYIQIADNGNAGKYVDEALAIAQEINYKKGIAMSYSNIGLIHNYQGNYPDALKYYLASLNIFEEIRDRQRIAKLLSNIGNIYGEQGNYPEALNYYFKSLKIDEEIEDKKGIGILYSNIGIIYDLQGNYPEALKNYFAALKIGEETGDKRMVANSHNNIGITYREQGNYPDALKNHLTSLKIREEIGDKNGVAVSNNNIGIIYEEQGNYPEALKNLFAALQIFEEIGDKRGTAMSCNSLGWIKLKMQNPEESKSWMMKGLKLAEEIGSLEIIKECYKGVSATDSALGNYKGAYENHKLYILYRDSLVNEQNIKKMTQQQLQYEFEKKEAETKVSTDAKLKKQKLIRNGFVSGFIIVGLFAIVILRQRDKIRKEKTRAEEETRHVAEEKKRSEDLLLNILPAEVATELKSTGTCKAKAFTLVTVMFTDFKDFTRVSEKVSAELLVDEIHQCFSAFDAIVQKYNIEKIKTIGDAYLCASGLPVSTHTHALDMLYAAFEIRSYMLQRKKEKEAKGEIPFELRIGIHTGPVVAGVVGVKKYAYDIWGDTVNIAARMEQNSEAGKINISGTTYELVKDKFNCTPRGKIKVKNKGEIDMYFVETIS